jgi:hypothetical protein
MNSHYVIDGTNVIWWYGQSHPNEASVKPLLTLLQAILFHGDSFYCVFDASTIHVLEGQGKKDEAEALQSIIRVNPKHFFKVTGSTRADGVILHYADHNKCRIITNDIYRDYYDKYDWLLDKYTMRLIQGNLQPNNLLTIEKLSYGSLVLNHDISKLGDRINHLIGAEGRSFSELSSGRQLDSTDGHEPHSKVNTEMKYGSIKVDTVPNGAEFILLNEYQKIKSITPCQIDKIAATKSACILSLPGYQSIEFDVKVSPSESVVLKPVYFTFRKMGRWSGNGTQTDGQKWNIEIAVTDRDFRATYHTIDCEAVWEVKSTNENIVYFKEKLYSGDCIKGGSIRITQVNDNLAEFEWYYPNGNLGSTAILRRYA